MAWFLVKIKVDKINKQDLCFGASPIVSPIVTFKMMPRSPKLSML